MKVSDKLRINIILWLKLMRDLKKAGVGYRESGGFLLGLPDSTRVTEYLCYHELDPNCLTGAIEFSHIGYSKLWAYLKKKNLVVLADVHTHPAAWTGQSIYDKENPMIAFPGHIALIVPNYAKKLLQFLDGVGIYEYLGSHKWKTLDNKSINITYL
jgi:hypothetical protein